MSTIAEAYRFQHFVHASGEEDGECLTCWDDYTMEGVDDPEAMVCKEAWLRSILDTTEDGLHYCGTCGHSIEPG